MVTNNVSDRLESHVAAIRLLKVRARRSTPRSRVECDRHFAALMELLSPRIRYLTQRYGLTDMVEDAGQACAIGVHRALQKYDPAKARFTTFVTWQLRGELQALRHRVRLDQRDSAKTAGARTQSLDAPCRVDGLSLGETLPDPDGTGRTESGARAAMAERTAEMLFEDYTGHMRELAFRRLDRQARPGEMHAEDMAEVERTLARERAILEHFVLGRDDPLDDGGMTAEQKRQVVRRASRHIAGRAATMPQFLTLRPGARH